VNQPPHSKLSGAEVVAEDEADVGGALRETAHEVGEPLRAEGHVDAHAVAITNQLTLEIGANSIEHLKLKIILGDFLFRGPADGGRDHARIVRGNRMIETAGKESARQVNVVPVNVSFPLKGNFDGLFVGALAEANAATIGEEIVNIALAAVEIRLDDGTDRGGVRANTLDEFHSALGVHGTFHVNAQETIVGRGALRDGKHQSFAEFDAEIQPELR